MLYAAVQQKWTKVRAGPSAYAAPAVVINYAKGGNWLLSFRTSRP